MKKLIFAIAVAALSAHAADTSTAPAVPHLTVTERTNVVRLVAPLVLNREAMDGIISACMAMGVSADARISSTNLASVEVRAVRIGTNDAFRVVIRLK